MKRGRFSCVIAGWRTVERSWGPWHRSRLIAFAVTQSPEPPVCRRGSDKRRQMNRSEIPSFVCVSCRVSLPFNLGALNQSQDRLGHTLGRAMRCQSLSIAHRIIDRNPALSRDSVGGICDHHGRTQRNECHTRPLSFSFGDAASQALANLGNGCPMLGQGWARLPNAWAMVAQCLGKVGQRLHKAWAMVAQGLAIVAQGLGNRCPSLGQLLPKPWALGNVASP